jgi:hypothetical protein
LATKGRSLLGRIFLGAHTLGPDFLNSGTLVLENLELGSKYTWDLAHRDLFGEKCFYDDTTGTPYVFIFDGTSNYGTLAEIFDSDDQKGTDGCVRWSGVSLNSRKITLDFTRTPEFADRLAWSDWTNRQLSMVPIAGVNHNQILSEPPAGLQRLVVQALNVASSADYAKFYTDASGVDVVQKAQAQLDKDQWVQFVVHAVDERGNGIDDFSVEVLLKHPDGSFTSVSQFEQDVHPYGPDKSYRAFHVHLTDISADLFRAGNNVIVSFRASSGTDIVRYQGFGDAASTSERVQLDVTGNVNNTVKKLFLPFTTTLMEIRLNREPIPLPPVVGVVGTNYEIFQFMAGRAAGQG